MSESKLSKFLFANIFPLKYFYSMLFFLLICFLSPILLLASTNAFELFIEHPALFISLGIFFLFFAVISVFLFVQLKNPFMQEWKDKLGYEEKQF